MARPAFIWHPDYEIEIGPHVFPTDKFRLLKEQLVSEGLVTAEEVKLAPAPTEEELLAVFTPNYWADLKRGDTHTARTRASELPITPKIIAGCARTSGGTLEAARRAMECGGACHFGGGFHHGYADHAEGFCYINDVAVAAANMKRLGLCQRVAIIDADVHQGNGTAHIFRNDPAIYTFSIHQERLYPSPKEKGDWDIGLEVGATGADYLPIFRNAIGRIMAQQKPDLVIYLGGADTAAGDQLGRLNLTDADMLERDQIILGACAAQRVPFVTVVAGGYQRDVSKTVTIHANTVKVAIDVLVARR